MTTRDYDVIGGVRVRAASLLHGAVRLVDRGQGWVRPWRLTDAQVRVLGSTSAWHPGLYRQMARTTAGMTLEFETDSSAVIVEARVDAMPQGSAAVLADVRRTNPDAPDLLDGISYDVDGTHVGVRLPDEGEWSLELALDDPNGASGASRRLPGMGGSNHHVTVWLPALMGCELRSVMGDGTYLKAVPERGQLLVIGDSIAQGFVTGDPALSWPARLAREYGLDLVNQSIGGQVFQPGFARAAGASLEPEKVVVALGGNYRFEPCGEARVRADVVGLLADVRATWPDSSVWAITPTPYYETLYRTNPRSCFERLGGLIRDAAEKTGVSVVDGQLLLDIDLDLMADASDHPNARGAAQMAERLAFAMDAQALPDEDRRLRVMELLEDAPMAAFPLREIAERGTGEVLFADEGCILVRLWDGQQVIWATNRPLARRVMRLLCEPTTMMVLSSELIRDVRRVLGLVEERSCHLAVYESKDPIEPVGAFDVRELDGSWEREVIEHLGHPELLSPGELGRMLEAGGMLGGFEGDELVGFIGARPEGMMDLLQVFPGHRRQGWACALEGALINRQLAQGLTPWGEVWPSNVAALALQDKLGLAIYPAGDLTLMAKAADDGVLAEGRE